MTAKPPKHPGMTAPLKDILQEIKEGLQKRYSSKLKGIMLFGSYARGEQRAGSDIDIAIILEDFSHACIEIEQTSDIISSISL